MNSIIAIDGPAGSGKSTVARLVAKKLGFVYIDTGAMYRAITLKAIRKNIDLEDERALADLARKTTLDITNDKDGKVKVFLDNEDITNLIRTPQLTANVYFLASVEGVRNEMVKLQREIGKRQKCVFEGRDITTVVFPQTKYKFYLDATPQERAKRRHEELLTQGEGISYQDVEKDVRERDHKDTTRKVAPLKKARDAIYIDTTNMSIEEVVNKVCSYIK